MRNLKLAAMASLAAITAAGPALAATATANLNVKITIENECKTAAASDLDFGTHGVLDENVDEQTDITVTCTTGQAYTVGLSAGGGSGATTTTRKLSGGGGTIDYRLFRNSARDQNWGDTVGELASGTGDGSAQTLTVYGRVTPQTTPTAGVYTDTVTVTVTY